MPRQLVRPVVLVAVMAASACGEVERPLPLIPLPAEISVNWADTFHVSDETVVAVDTGDSTAVRLGHLLSEWLGNNDDTRPPVVHISDAGSAPGAMTLRLDGDTEWGAEEYRLQVDSTGVLATAGTHAGLFYALQTLRQLLPPAVEYGAAFPSPMTAPSVEVYDRPRYEWRGAMLDVSRHFLPARDVKRFIDLMALHKLNRLHLHLSDDQGWRIEIPGWPQLTEVGGSTEVGGGEGGFYTADQYRGIVEYAADRFITVIPEIDVPGHTNAALASVPELNCDGVSPDLYTGTAVGFSSLCTELDLTYEFLDDVVGALSEMTPGPYFHMGGDEVRELSEEQYAAFSSRMQGIIESHGRTTVGWDEIALASVRSGSVIQLWRPFWKAAGSGDAASESEAGRALREGVLRAIEGGAQVILSPADRLYLDLKYDRSTRLGLTWAGIPDTRAAYDWRVDDLFASLPPEAILGVEAPLWSETVAEVEDFEYMAFPRLAGVAEIGWTPADRRDWRQYRLRLGRQAPRWTALGINFHRAPSIPWSPERYER